MLKQLFMNKVATLSRLQLDLEETTPALLPLLLSEYFEKRSELFKFFEIPETATLTEQFDEILKHPVNHADLEKLFQFLVAKHQEAVLFKDIDVETQLHQALDNDIPGTEILPVLEFDLADYNLFVYDQMKDDIGLKVLRVFDMPVELHYLSQADRISRRAFKLKRLVQKLADLGAPYLKEYLFSEIPESQFSESLNHKPSMN